MRRQMGGISKTQGAARLFIAALGILVMLAAPPSLRNLINTNAISAAQHVSEQRVPPLMMPSSQERRGLETSPDTAGSFHSADDAALAGSMSHGALGMLMLAAFSLLLLLWAFLLRTRQARQDDR